MRPQQLEMKQRFALAIAGNAVLVAEAGTGTGKTCAYLCRRGLCNCGGLAGTREVDTLAADDPLLRVRPFTEPVPTRRVGLVWRSSFPRQQAIDALHTALLDCRLPGTQPVH